jgi:hypothetical protein
MIRVSVGETDRDIRDVNVPWLRERIEDMRRKGVPVCVRVTIKSGDLDMILSTLGCPASSGGNRPPRPKEKEVFDLWEKRGLNLDDFNIGQLNAFLSEIKHL